MEFKHALALNEKHGRNMDRTGLALGPFDNVYSITDSVVYLV